MRSAGGWPRSSETRSTACGRFRRPTGCRCEVPRSFPASGMWPRRSRRGGSIRDARLMNEGHEQRVRDAMVPDPHALEAGATAQDAGEALMRPEVRSVLVCDRGEFVGVITRKTLV